MAVDYCCNCGWHSPLKDGVYCHFCLDGFYRLGHLPTRDDRTEDNSARGRAYRDLGWVPSGQNH